MIPTAYFWREGQLIEFYGDTSVYTVAKAGLSDLYAVDLTTPLPIGKFGMYKARSAWRHIPLEKFPADFRATLLLLGIT